MAPTQRFRVLLVEDHDDTRAVMARLLSQHFDVTSADSYDTALRAAAETNPHAIVTDITLGRGADGGMELMRELRKTSNVVGIAVSGHPPRDPDALAAAGLVKWFLKPIHFRDLVAAVEGACAASATSARNSSDVSPDPGNSTSA